MSGEDAKFNNPYSGESLIRWTDNSGFHHLKIVQTGVPGDRGGHSILSPSGTPSYIRDVDGRIICDDKL